MAFGDSIDLPTATDVNGNTNSIALGSQIEASPSETLFDVAGVANWGFSELVYVRNTGAAIPLGSIVTVSAGFVITLAPNTGATGVPVYVTLTSFSIGSTTPQGGWVLRSGICPVKFAVAATAGAVYISTTAGSATPTNPTGQKQIVNATTMIPVATTFTRTVQTRTGSKTVRVNTAVGMFPGQAVTTPSNTPIPAGTTISSIDPSGQFITVSNAAIASSSATGTFTMTGFGICQFDRAHMQGSVT
jgi:hypothetical protein